MKKKVLVAMSGGVDSSVAALLLKQKGCQVVGVTMCLGLPDPADAAQASCCGGAAIEDAKGVCRQLDIPHYVLDFSSAMQELVVGPFVAEYIQGRTPNPCVRCNQFLKFGRLLEYARNMEFDWLATGHYARITQGGGSLFLERPRDRLKDQTYFLYVIKKEDLGAILFPLADYTKEEVRQIAQAAGLTVAQRPQSQDICFIPDGDCGAFVSRQGPAARPGPIVDLAGRSLGQHRGLCFYTLGQRKGLGIAAKAPLYVVAIDSAKNQIVVGSRSDLNSCQFLVSAVNSLTDGFSGEIYAKIRYAHKPAKCQVWEDKDGLRVVFNEPQEAVTPGQAVVFYQQDRVCGGGIIARSGHGCS